MYFVCPISTKGLARKTCALCKCLEVNHIAGGYCISCGKIVDVVLLPNIEGVQGGGVPLKLSLGRGIVDRVLQLEEPFLALHEKSVDLIYVALFDVEVYKKLFVDLKAAIVSFFKA